MKITTFSPLILLFLLTNSLAATATPVLDFFGKPLEVGVRYRILTPKPDISMVTLAGTNNQQCPQSVVVGPPFPPFPTPESPIATFHPSNASETLIHESTVLNIKFEIKSPCPESTVWRLHPTDSTSPQSNFILTGGELGNPGCDTLFNWFKFEFLSVDAPGWPVYKIVYNPQVCFPYRDSNVTKVDGRLYVNVEDDPNKRLLRVMFRKEIGKPRQAAVNYLRL